VTVSGVLERLLAETDASRCTLRLDLPGETFFPVVEEALAPGVQSIRDVPTDLRSQPVVRELQTSLVQIVQDDCRAASDDPRFHALMEAFGGVAAQIVTPVVVDGRLAGIVSLHQLGRPRAWTPREAGLAATSAADVAAILAA
jgi:GAF domain-containing protein